ncbi:hypothetical protein C0989_001457 [Termitomyces sp. Mn162]|nr:hypothetical protein C0989_001457 [Termitomyces sp. Mn162]
MAQESFLPNGTYKIVNNDSGNVITLSTQDNTTIMASTDMSLDNQKWVVEIRDRKEKQYLLHSLHQTETHETIYLGYSKQYPSPGDPVIGVTDLRTYVLSGDSCR